MSYRQLTEGQRYQISLLLSEKFSLRKIAEKLDVSPSTISREPRRNSVTPGCYEPCYAHNKARQRRSESYKRGLCQKYSSGCEVTSRVRLEPRANLGCV